jgi:uncharacterized protein (TIRG00374 family)
MMKKIQIAVSLLISVVCLYFAFRNIDWVETWEAIKRANYLYIALTVFVTLGSVWLRSYRWKFMLDPLRKVPVGGLYESTMIGFMANNVLPARLGEFVRAYAVGRAHGVSKSAAFATIVIERAFDMLTLVLCLGVVLLLVPLSPAIKLMGMLAIGVTLVMFGVLVFFRQRRDLVVRLAERLTRSLPTTSRERGERLLHSFIDGLEVLAKGGHILAILGLSLIMWASVMLSFDLAMRAFGLPVPLYASMVLLVVVSLGLMIPSGPGFAGTFEAAMIWALLLFPGVSKEQAASCAIMYHATQFVPITAFGLYYLWKSNLSLTDASKDGGPA